MSISREEVQGILQKFGFFITKSNAKVVEFENKSDGRVIYFRPASNSAIAKTIRMVINPNESYNHLISIDGVNLYVNNKKKNEDISVSSIRHGSNMTKFPKKINDGKEPIHYGRAFDIKSIDSLNIFVSAYLNQR